MRDIDYWTECIDIAAEECCLALTDEQRSCLAESVSGGHENYGMAFYSPPAGEHLKNEILDLEQRLKREREKVHCEHCGGRGSITTYGPAHSATSTCWKCKGDGRHDP